MVENNSESVDELTASLSAPVCRFRQVGDRFVIRETNQAFTERFGSGHEGEPVSTIFASVFGYSVDSEFVDTVLTDRNQFRVSGSRESGPDEEYLGTVFLDGGCDGGSLQFRSLSDIPRFEDADGGTYTTVESDEVDFETPTEDESATRASDSPADGLAVDHVASVVSHDLRNPLDVARARLRAGREFGEDEHFDHVEQAHDRMERIIQDVLTLARGEDVVDPDERVNLGAVAEQAWESVETNDAHLVVEDHLPTALADPDRVSRLFENLFRNSVEHAHSDDGLNRVSGGRLADGSTDGFYVADAGPGIPEANRADIFEPGYSSDDHGTGLGLAIVARIADLHGWDVTVTESDSGGARFDVRGVQ